jgi:hypothetical protein
MKRTPQYLFDRVVRQMISQGGPSLSKSGFCSYRGPGGRKCAVGAILPDNAYFAGMEDVNVCGLADLEPPVKQAAAYKVWVDEVLTPNRNLLSDMQAAHDNSGNLDVILERLRDVAREHGLDAASLKEVAHA